MHRNRRSHRGQHFFTPKIYESESERDPLEKYQTLLSTTARLPGFLQKRCGLWTWTEVRSQQVQLPLWNSLVSSSALCLVLQ